MGAGLAVLDMETSTHVALLALCVAVAIHLFFWYRLGRDPKGRGTVVPVYDPPDGLSPAALRYIWRNGIDDRTFAAAILNLAVKDVIRLTRAGGIAWLLSPGKTGPEGLPESEATVATSLFENGSKRVSNPKKAPGLLGTGLLDLGDAVRLEVKDTYFAANIGYVHAGMAAGFIGLAIAYGLDVGAWAGFKLAALQWWIMFWAIILFAESKRSARSIFDSKFGFIGRFFLIALTLGAVKEVVGDEWPALGTLTMIPVFVLVNLGFVWLIGSPTVRGRRVMDEIEGFRHFLSVTEWGNLQTYPTLHAMPEPLLKLMPYVLALEVEHPWTDEFAGAVEPRSTDLLVNRWEWSGVPLEDEGRVGAGVLTEQHGLV